MSKKDQDNQLNIDLSLFRELGDIKIRRFVTNDWPAPLLMNVLAAVCSEINNYYDDTKHASSVLDEANQAYDEINKSFPSWDESQRLLFKLGFLSRRYDDRLLEIGKLQEHITQLRDEKGIDD